MRVMTLVLLSSLIAGPLAAAEWVEGYTEPNRTIRVATAETGIVQTVLVHEGEHVKQGQPLASLDDDLHRSAVTLAEQQASARGRLQSAQAELAFLQHRLDKLIELRRAGQAHQEEVDRATSDVQVSAGKLLTEQEEQRLLQLQYERAKLQLARRTILAPMDGIVTQLHRHQGEHISAATPDLLTLVELTPLKATFLLERPQALKLKPQQEARLRLGETGPMIRGQVEYVSEVIDAQSGLTTVKVRLDNADRKLRSGERCLLEIP